MRLSVELKYDYKIEMLAPDEGRDQDDDSAWQFRIFGTPDEVLETKGVYFLQEASLDRLSSVLMRVLYTSVSSSVVDETRARIETALEELYNRYRSTTFGPFWIDTTTRSDRGLGNIVFFHVHVDGRKHATSLKTPDGGWVSIPGQYDPRVTVCCKECPAVLGPEDKIEFR